MEAAEAQFNMAMPHWTLRIVSDADAAVSLFVGLKTKFATISIKIFTIHCAQKEDQRFHCTRTGKHIGLISISLFQVVTRKKSAINSELELVFKISSIGLVATDWTTDVVQLGSRFV